jgi:catechol 2,3-dioxygenase
MTTTTLPASTSLGAVHLTVTELERALEFYTQRLGFHLHGRTPDGARLGAGADDLLVLTGSPGAPRVPRTTGLFHFAVLLPGREDLARAFRHLTRTRAPIQGASDHGVSEALYLADPDGNGIEVYRDRPRDDWPTTKGQLRMFTHPLDLNALFDAVPDGGEGFVLPRGTRIGHVHLQVAHLDAAERFYVDVLGFDLVQRYGPDAAFVSAGGYHHHIGLNMWAGVGVPAPPAGAVGLRHFEVRLPEVADVERVLARVRAAGVPVERAPDGASVVDPSGNRVKFVHHRKGARS